MWFIDIPPYIVTIIALCVVWIEVKSNKEWCHKYHKEYPLAKPYNTLAFSIMMLIFCIIQSVDYYFNCIDFRNGLLRSYEARIWATDIVIMTFCLSQKPWKSLKDTFSEKGITRDKVGYILFFMSFLVIALAIEHHYYYYNGEHLLFVVLKRIGLM